MKRFVLVLALVTMLAMVVAPVALADENEAGWWGNIVGYPFQKNAICITAVDGSMINNCHAQDPLRPYEPIKFDGVSPKVYIVTSGPAKAFLFAQPGQDNWIDWAWMVPGWWTPGMAAPAAPSWHMWHPGSDDGMTKDGPPVTTVKVDQNVNVTGSGTVGQSVNVKSNGPTNVTVDQKVTMKAPVTAASKVVCFTYVVKTGDNLSRIAVKYGDTVSGLVSRNHITNPSKIIIGQRLTVCDP